MRIEKPGRTFQTLQHTPGHRDLPGIARTYRLALGAIVLVTSFGCAIPRPLKGGKAVTALSPNGRWEQRLVQGDNAAQQSRQSQDTLRVRTYTLPAGACMEEANVVTPGDGAAVTNVHTIVLNQPMPVVEREESRAASELGAAQKDTARELGARLSSLRGITWVGVGLFVFGLASLVWPPLKAVVGSVTTSAAIVVAGLMLMVLPTLVAGNEVLILAGVGLTAGAWFLAYRHGNLRGQLFANTQSTESSLSAAATTRDAGSGNTQ